MALDFRFHAYAIGQSTNRPSATIETPPRAGKIESTHRVHISIPIFPRVNMVHPILAWIKSPHPGLFRSSLDLLLSRESFPIHCTNNHFHAVQNRSQLIYISDQEIHGHCSESLLLLGRYIYRLCLRFGSRSNELNYLMGSRGKKSHEDAMANLAGGAEKRNSRHVCDTISFRLATLLKLSCYFGSEMNLDRKVTPFDYFKMPGPLKYPYKIYHSAISS